MPKRPDHGDDLHLGSGSERARKARPQAICRGLLLLLGFAALAEAAAATPVTFGFSGHLVSGTAEAPPELAAGTEYQGSYTFDSAAIPSCDPWTCRYDHTTAPFGLSIELPGGSIHSDPTQAGFFLEIGITNDLAIGMDYVDRFFVRSDRFTNTFASAVVIDSFSWSLDSFAVFAPGPFTSRTDYPLDPAFLAEFPPGQSFFIQGHCETGCSAFTAAGTIEKLWLVPEPGTGLLVASSLGVSMITRKRRNLITAPADYQGWCFNRARALTTRRARKGGFR